MTANQDTFTPPDWSGDPGPALENLRQYAEGKIEGEWQWYVRNKKGKSATSQRLRLGAVVLSVMGGLVPLLIALFGSRPAWPWLAAFGDVRFGQLGYLLLALAAGLVLLDKFFGYSTSWMRFVIAMQAIEKARESFRLDWAALSRKLSAETAGTVEHRELVERLVERVRSAILEVKEQSQKETEAWVTEFQTNLSQLEKDLKSQVDASRPGGIDVEVPDGARADTSVELSLDGMVAERFSGTVGSIGFVAPGLHRVTAKAQKANRDFASSALVTVGAGQICRVRLTLGIP